MVTSPRAMVTINGNTVGNCNVVSICWLLTLYLGYIAV